MRTLDSVTYQSVEGSKARPSLRVFALSTCAFCERSLTWLKAMDYSHEFIFVDNLDPEVKRQLKTELKDLFGPIQVFPVLVIDGNRMISGFTEDKWKEALGIA